MVSTVQFLALKKAKAVKFLKLISYLFAVRNNIMNWTEQRCSSEFLMGQNKEIALLPTK